MEMRSSGNNNRKRTPVFATIWTVLLILSDVVERAEKRPGAKKTILLLRKSFFQLTMADQSLSCQFYQSSGLK